MPRRNTTRIYHIAPNTLVKLSKEWSMKFGRNLWYVYEYGPDQPKTLGKFPTFKEARNFIKDGAGERCG